MILTLITSTPVCKLSFIDGDWRFDDEWNADRSLAKSLLAYIDEKLKQNNKTWSDITGIGAFRGPGSFTGLRIGLTVVNTIADANKVPIVGGTGDDWQNDVINRLKDGENDKIVLPLYGSEAHITTPKK